MRSTTTAFRITLVALAGAFAAAIAHLVVDIAGDYVLARDAYDGIAHHSRTLLLAAIGTVALVFVARMLFDALDRRCGSATSLLRLVRDALGHPVRFAAAATAVAIVGLAAMEYFDCTLGGVRIDGIGDLYGGSLALGLTTAVACGMLSGGLLHRLLRALSDYEPAIAQFVFSILRTEFASTPQGPVHRRTDTAAPVERRLLLARRGRKRGPPLAIPG